MERIQRLILKTILLIFVIFGLGCSSTPKPEDVAELQVNEEFDQVVQVEALPVEHQDQVQPEKPNLVKSEKDTETKSKTKSKTKKKTAKKKPPTKKKAAPQKKAKKTEKTKKTVEPEQKAPSHLPELEDGEGFVGRRPVHDPFRVGTRHIMDVDFSGINAGTIELAVKPFVQVNGEKSYHFYGRARTNSFFSFFYEVDDRVETYVRFRDLVPLTFALHVRESKQYREARTFFDWKNLRGKHWEKKIRNGKKEEKKQEWDILPFSQNVVSAFFYLRLFNYKVGKKYRFRVADTGKNIVATLDVKRKEKIKTEAGEFDAFVAKIEFEYDGVFKPVGDIYAWIIDQPDRPLARIEAKIKLGTLSLELTKIE